MKMNKKVINVIITTFIFINILSVFPKNASADVNKYLSFTTTSETSIYSVYNYDDIKDDKKEKLKGFSLFSEENYRYLSSEQRREFTKLKKCKENGENLSPEQEKTLTSIIDCIIKGKLGNTDYEEFKCLIEKKSSKAQLTEKEEIKLKDYKDIINGHKLSSKEILNQFLRQ
jgi:hypothetical protein